MTLETLLATLLIASSVRLQAQALGRIIRGTVLDGRDQPVVSVTISAPGTTTTTDDSGRFRINVANRDRVVFEARRIGYMPTRLSVAPGGDTVVSILLLASAQALPEVKVNDAAIAPPGIAGFERRMLERQRGAGTGHFITAKDIEKMSPMRTTQIVETVPSIVVRRTSGDNFAIFGRYASGGECAATVYVDGVRMGGMGNVLIGKDRRGRATVMRTDTDSPLDQWVEPNEVAGVEVYARGLLAPPQFVPNDPNAARCSIVVFWTKHAK